MTVKRKKARSAPLLVIYAVDKATIKQLEGAIFRIAKSKMEWELKRDAIKALLAASEPRQVAISNCDFSAD